MGKHYIVHTVVIIQGQNDRTGSGVTWQKITLIFPNVGPGLHFLQSSTNVRTVKLEVAIYTAAQVSQLPLTVPTAIVECAVRAGMEGGDARATRLERPHP